MNEVQKGQASKEILENPLVVEALSVIETTIRDEWTNTQTAEVREELWFTLQGAMRFKHTLEVAIQNADFAIAQMENEE